jgi:hypothetical protein
MGTLKMKILVPVVITTLINYVLVSASGQHGENTLDGQLLAPVFIR